MKKSTDRCAKILMGAVCGLLNGFFGGGGGMICVPVLSKFYKLSQKKAHATALAVMVFLSISSAVFYLVFNGFNFTIGIPTGIGVIVGGALGAVLLKKINNKALQFVFALIMILGGIKMII